MKKETTRVHEIDGHCADRSIRDFKIASFSEVTCTVAEFEERHRHDFFEIIWLKNGSGTHHIDLNAYAYSGSVLFILSPGQIHRLEADRKSEGYVIKFRTPLLGGEPYAVDRLHEICLSATEEDRPVIPVPRRHQPQLEELFLNLTDEFAAPRADSEQLYAAHVKILLIWLGRLKEDSDSGQRTKADPGRTLYRDFRIALEKNHGALHAVDDYAKLLRVKSRTLNAIARRFCAKSAGEMIRNRVILEAKRRLYHEAVSVKGICYELGFSDPAYFARFFRKHVGCSPQAFRAKVVGA